MIFRGSGIKLKREIIEIKKEELKQLKKINI